MSTFLKHVKISKPTRLCLWQSSLPTLRKEAQWWLLCISTIKTIPFWAGWGELEGDPSRDKSMPTLKEVLEGCVNVTGRKDSFCAGQDRNTLTSGRGARALRPDCLNLDPDSATCWKSWLLPPTLPPLPNLGNGDKIVSISKRLFSELI